MSQSSQENFRQGVEALARADFPEAIARLEEALAEDGENAEAWQQLAAAYLETRQPHLAVEALKRSLVGDDSVATTHYLLGTAHGTLGQLDQAAACYRRALEIDPEHAKAEEFLMRTESLLESREHYRAGLRLLYSAAPTAADLNQAIRELVQSAAIFPDSPARDSLAECAHKLLALKTEWPVGAPLALAPWARACERGYQCLFFANWVGAREAYAEALEYRVEDAFVHHALGFASIGLEDPEGAVRAWLRALELDPGYDFTRLGRPERRKENLHG